MPLIEVDRSIAADPKTVALMLSGPAAGELWPGAAQVSGSLARLRLRTQVPGRGLVDADVAVSSPRTGATTYAADFVVESDQLPPIRGRLRLTYRPPDPAHPTTHASLTFDYQGRFPDRLRQLAERYLDSIAAATESGPASGKPS